MPLIEAIRRRYWAIIGTCTLLLGLGLGFILLYKHSPDRYRDVPSKYAGFYQEFSWATGIGEDPRQRGLPFSDLTQLYRVNAKPDDVAAFYHKQLLANTWTTYESVPLSAIHNICYWEADTSQIPGDVTGPKRPNYWGNGRYPERVLWFIYGGKPVTPTPVDPYDRGDIGDLILAVLIWPLSNGGTFVEVHSCLLLGGS